MHAGTSGLLAESAILYADGALVHGRGEMTPISTGDQTAARGLARRAACALVELASNPAITRQVALEQLLEEGPVLVGDSREKRNP